MFGFGSAWSRVRNISIGEMMVALNVRAVAPATSGAGVRWVGGAESGIERTDGLLSVIDDDGARDDVSRARRYS